VPLRSSRFRSSFRSATRRQSSWEVGPSGRVTDSANAVTLFPLGGQAVDTGLTIVRVRGHLNLMLETATAVNDGFDRVACGLAVVSENAFSAGVASVPDPNADIAWDGWMWHWIGSVMAAAPAASFPGFGNTGAQVVVVDTKAMRKFKETDVLIGVLSVNQLNGAAALQSVLNTRVLVKLP